MQIVDIQKDKNNIVKKHNELIKAKGALSQTAQKMLSMVIAMIRVDDTEFQSYALSISSYKKEIESKSKKSKKDFIENAYELMSNPFEINKQLFNWCSKVDWGSLDGYIIFDIHKDLKPYLLELKEDFTEYSLINILHLKGIYSPRLYEYFLMQYGQRKYGTSSYQFDLKIDDLRGLLKIKDSYKYDKIKLRILNKAKTDFKKYTDIQFEYKEQKIGRKVDRLIITIKPNAKKIDKKIVPANEYPIEVMALKGTPNFSNDDDFIIAYDDGSFQLKKANGSYVYFKSLKQFIYMLHNKEF